MEIDDYELEKEAEEDDRALDAVFAVAPNSCRITIEHGDTDSQNEIPDHE